MNEIQIRSIRVLTGANIWAYCPVLEILTDIGKYEYLPSDRLPNFTERLAEAIPSLWEHRCSEAHLGGFLERLREGTYMGHILEHIILELQSLAGMSVTYGKTRQAEREGEYYIVFNYKDSEAARMCVDLAVEIATKLAEGQELDLDIKARIDRIREVGEDNMLGPSTQAIVDAARSRGIPWMRLDGGSLVQLGHGCHARRIQASETSLTSSVGADIASNKELTKALLQKVGIPTPRGELVSDPDAAWEVALSLGAPGVPVVVKPGDGNQGKAVSVGLTTEAQVRQAYELARDLSPQVLVEEYVPGSDYRLLVVDGKMVAAALRRPAQVVADGLHTIRDLVGKVNDDPQRGRGHGAALTRIKMDAAAELSLAKQGLTWDSVPSAGQVVLLRDNSNLSTGGTALDVTGRVHPDNAAMAVLAARMVGLDVAGVDVVCENIGRPFAEQSGAIVEVNAAPGLRMHIYPAEGKPRRVGEAIVDMLFPRGTPARVPLVAVTGTNGKTTVVRMIAHVFSTMQKYVGLTTTDGIYFGGVRRVKGDCSGPRSAEAVLQHPMVEVAVLETARGGILRSGLAWDRSDVSVVLNVAGDHMGLGGINTLEQLARVKRVVIESVSSEGYGVLNADDPLTADMAEYCPGKVLFFGTDCSSAVMTAHLAAGGRAAYLQDGSLVLAEGGLETVLLKASDVPATYGGLIPFQVQNALAAAAACWGAGVPLDSIKLGLRTFQADDHSAPGRFNMFDAGTARVIVDYGHNPHAFKAMHAAVTAMDPRRAIGVVGAPGDRRDADIEELAAVAAGTFDWVIVREDDDLRGREPGAVAHLIADTIARINPSLPVCIITDEQEAVDQALEMARDNDLVVVFADHVDEVTSQVRRICDAMAAEQAGALWRPISDHDGLWEHDRIHAVADLAAQGIYPVPTGLERDNDDGATSRLNDGAKDAGSDKNKNSYTQARNQGLTNEAGL